MTAFSNNNYIFTFQKENEQKKRIINNYCVGINSQRSFINKRLKRQSVNIISSQDKYLFKKLPINKEKTQYLRQILIKTCFQEFIPFCSFWVLCKMKKDGDGNKPSEKSTKGKKVAHYTYKVRSVCYINTQKKKK